MAVEGENLGWGDRELDTLSRPTDRDIEASEALVRELSPDGLAPILLGADEVGQDEIL